MADFLGTLALALFLALLFVAALGFMMAASHVMLMAIFGTF